jgi:hypothetical protein
MKSNLLFVLDSACLHRDEQKVQNKKDSTQYYSIGSFQIQIEVTLKDLKNCFHPVSTDSEEITRAKLQFMN